jgi:hypothetical protein
MRPGDLPGKEGDVYAIKKFKPDKEGDVQTYSGISQSGAREIMVSWTVKPGRRDSSASFLHVQEPCDLLIRFDVLAESRTPPSKSCGAA